MLPAGVAVQTLAPRALDALLWCGAAPCDEYMDLLAERALRADTLTPAMDRRVCDTYARLRSRAGDLSYQARPSRTLGMHRRLLVARCTRAPHVTVAQAWCAVLVAPPAGNASDALVAFSLTHGDSMLLQALCAAGLFYATRRLLSAQGEWLTPLQVLYRAPPRAYTHYILNTMLPHCLCAATSTMITCIATLSVRAATARRP